MQRARLHRQRRAVGGVRVGNGVDAGEVAEWSGIETSLVATCKASWTLNHLLGIGTYGDTLRELSACSLEASGSVNMEIDSRQYHTYPIDLIEGC
jgi:hypothetical protein